MTSTCTEAPISVFLTAGTCQINAALGRANSGNEAASLWSKESSRHLGAPESTHHLDRDIVKVRPRKPPASQRCRLTAKPKRCHLVTRHGWEPKGLMIFRVQ